MNCHNILKLYMYNAALQKFYYIEKEGEFYSTCSMFYYILPQQSLIGECNIT